MYLILLLPNHKQTYDQIDLIEKNKLQLFIANWSYSYDLKRDFDTYQRMRANSPSWTGTRQIRDVVMQTSEPDSARESTDHIVKTLDSTYANADLQNAAKNTVHLKSEQRKKLPGLFNEFEDLFGGTLGKQSTVPVDLQINPGSKLFNDRY